MNTTSLLIASLLLSIPIFISYKEHIGIEKEIIISVLRAIIQLVLVGYVLETIFGFENPIFIILLVSVMIINASLNTKKRGAGIKNVVLISFISISIGTLITMTVLIIGNAIKFTANEVIPISGMIISNAMVAIGLSYRNLNTSFREKRGEVEVKLSLGADINIASKDIIRESIKISMMPTIDSAKTLGIVALPGMMTGLILAGCSC